MACLWRWRQWWLYNSDCYYNNNKTVWHWL